MNPPATATEPSPPPQSRLSPLLVVISAPSGACKTTLCEQALAARKSMPRAVTSTTRPPRDGEQDGVDYYFLDAADFLRRVQAGNFLEHATVHGNSYGTLKSEVLGKLRAGRDVLLSLSAPTSRPGCSEPGTCSPGRWSVSGPMRRIGSSSCRTAGRSWR